MKAYNWKIKCLRIFCSQPFKYTCMGNSLLYEVVLNFSNIRFIIIWHLDTGMYSYSQRIFLLIILFCIASFRGLSLRMSLGALGELQHSSIFIGHFIFVGHYCPHKCVMTFILEYKVFIRGRCVWELLFSMLWISRAIIGAKNNNIEDHLGH